MFTLTDRKKSNSTPSTTSAFLRIAQMNMLKICAMMLSSTTGNKHVLCPATLYFKLFWQFYVFLSAWQMYVPNLTSCAKYIFVAVWIVTKIVLGLTTWWIIVVHPFLWKTNTGSGLWNRKGTLCRDNLKWKTLPQLLNRVEEWLLFCPGSPFEWKFWLYASFKYLLPGHLWFTQMPTLFIIRIFLSQRFSEWWGCHVCVPYCSQTSDKWLVQLLNSHSEGQSRYGDFAFWAAPLSQ